jgi:hypothetical protein
MATDAGQPVASGDRHDIWRLPEILEVRTAFRRFDPPRRVTRLGVDLFVEEAVEVGVELSEPFEIRALGPALWIGDEPLTIAEGDGPTSYRFLAFEPDALKPGAPIALSWNASDAPRVATKYLFEPPRAELGV